MTPDGDAVRLKARSQELLRDYQREIYSRTDRMFAVLMLVQWLAAIVASLWLAPHTWSGASARVHPHVLLAVFLGAVLCWLPIWFVWRRPGEAITRHVIAVSQVMFSSLLIHVSGGRIETHFHVFGSLAFLAAYRDWRVLIPATLFVAVDHWVRGVLWPETVFGVVTTSPWRWMEHAAWVLFEDVVLMINIRQSVTEMRNVSRQTARLEDHAELRRYSEQLARAVEKERAFIEGALDAVVEMDRRGVITGWNSQAEQTFGWSASEALGQLLANLVIPEPYRKAHREGLQRYRTTGHGPALNKRLDLEALHRDGHTFPIEIAITPVHQHDQTVFCAFVRDISVRKRHESDLRQATERAEAASRAKSEFLANMSHEIRTPLNGILGFTDVLRRRVGSPEQQSQYLNMIYASGQHLLTLINDILDLSKIEAGRMEFEQVQCSPHGVIAEVLSILRVRAQEKAISLECRWTSGVPETIRTDPARLRQILINLAGNAIKFTERGGVTLLATVDVPGPDPRFVIEVRDTGIGIRPEHLERIFSPFVQADASITRQFGGTGLGLAISRQIARQLGGDVTVESELGLGSVFRVTLETGPLDGVRILDVPPTETIASRRRATADSLTCAQLQSARILVVEDGETNRDLMMVVLQDAGAAVVCAENGLLGVEAASRKPFDLILMDMQMPVMDGYAATRRLREQGCRLPIIALTAHAMRGDEIKCREAGCSGYLTKPIDVDVLLQTVASALTRAETTPGESLSVANACPSSNGSTSRLTGAAEQSKTADGAMAACRKTDSRLAPIQSTLPMDQPELQRIVEHFVDKLHDKLGEMQLAVGQGDLPKLADLAHWLKGTGGSVGFNCLTERARQLEQAAKQSAAAAINKNLRELRSLADRITIKA
jgi:two-component system sensor histidine kinase/response regulator